MVDPPDTLPVLGPNRQIRPSKSPSKTATLCAVLHADRERALIFGSLADRYERARPSYPQELIDDLMSGHPTSVLDVGCGTGKAARLLVARGCSVLGVEPDERMAAIAAQHGIDVEISSFEVWDGTGRTFDLVTSAQAWHWVDPAIGAPKAAALLRPGGRLAVFWNYLYHEPRTLAVLSDVYQRVAPAIATTTAALGIPPESEVDRNFTALSADGLFHDIEARSYAWHVRYSRERWLDYLSTCSDHALLPSATLAVLLHEVGDAIDTLGGSITVPYATILISARTASHDDA